MDDAELEKLAEALKAITQNPTTATDYEQPAKLNNYKLSSSAQDRVSEEAFWSTNKTREWAGKQTKAQQDKVGINLTPVKHCLSSIAQIEKKAEEAIKKLSEGQKRTELRENLDAFHKSPGYISWQKDASIRYSDALEARKAENETKLDKANSTGIGTKIDQNAQKIGGVIGVAALTVPAYYCVAIYDIPEPTIVGGVDGGVGGAKLGIKFGQYVAKTVGDRTAKLIGGDGSKTRRKIGEAVGLAVGGACGFVAGTVATAAAIPTGVALGAINGAVVDGPLHALESAYNFSKAVGEKTRGFGAGLIASVAVTPAISYVQKKNLEFNIKDDTRKLETVKQDLLRLENIQSRQQPQPKKAQSATKSSAPQPPKVVGQQVAIRTTETESKFDEAKKLLDNPKTQQPGTEKAQKISKPMSEESRVVAKKQNLNGENIPTLDPEKIRIEGMREGKFMMFRSSGNGLPAIVATYDIQQGKDGRIKASCTKIILPEEKDGWKRETVQDKKGVDVIQMKHTDGRVSVLCTAEEFQKCDKQAQDRARGQELIKSLSSSAAASAISVPISQQKIQKGQNSICP